MTMSIMFKVHIGLLKSDIVDKVLAVVFAVTGYIGVN